MQSSASSAVPRFELIAQVNKAKGLDGQLVAHALGELSVLRLGLEVWVVPPSLNGVRRTSLIAVQEHPHKRGVVLSLAAVDNKTKASELVGKYLLARTEDTGSFTYDESLRAAFLSKGSDLTTALPEQLASLEQLAPPEQGILFTDTVSGTLGTLVHIKRGPAYDLWVIEGPYGLLEVPAVEAYVVEESPEQITLALPGGFIEITTGLSPKSRAQSEGRI